MQIVRELDRDCWQAFLDCQPPGGIFNTPEMYQVFERAAGHEPELWVAVDAGRPVAMFAPVRVTVLGGPLRPLTSRSVAFGSVLAAPGEAGREGLGRLLQAYNQTATRRAVFTELRNPVQLNGLQATLDAQGYRFEDHLNFLIDLTQPESRLWSNIRSNARRNIRKAQAEGVEVAEVDDPAEMAAVYALLKVVYRRIQVPLPDESLFQAAFDVLRPRDMMRVLVARSGDVVIGALTLLVCRGVMLYWYTGTLREHSALRPADLLVWRALQLGASSGCRVFDFGGGGRADEAYGVRDFKAKFGGELVNYGRNVCVHGPVRLALSLAGYRLTRRFL
jgi:CelD/BcsL family acetyltransferase involved in cellulose biosynthesis